MFRWRVRLREQEIGWIWQCCDTSGYEVCRSTQGFKHRWEALKNFEAFFSDQIASIAARVGRSAANGADWVCEP